MAPPWASPRAIIAFEETAEELAKNVVSLGLDLDGLVRRKKLAIDYVHIDRTEILETGRYDLSGLFVRIQYAIESVGARRILLDTLEVLLSGFSNASVMRGELERLFRWLKQQGVTAVVTGERGDGTLTRGGLEEYVSDCVVALDHRVADQVTTRRARIVKYRGSSHGLNEYSFLIGDRGISVLPITGLGLDYPVSNARVSSGILALDEMLEGRGYFRGSSILVSGTAGTGKSSVMSSFAAASAKRGEKCLYFALEEPAAQLVRNMAPIGLDLQPHVERDALRILASRPTVSGLEEHLLRMHQLIEETKPRSVVIDPISNLVVGANALAVKAMLVRLFDHLKIRGVTGLFSFLSAPHRSEETDIGISSLIDTWIELRDQEHAGERNRAMYIHDAGWWELRLYVAGQTPLSMEAFANLTKVCEEHLQGRYRIQVVDLLVNPALARGDQIVAVPTLVRQLPPPMKKIIGDLSNMDRVLVGLNLWPLTGATRRQ